MAQKSDSAVRRVIRPTVIIVAIAFTAWHIFATFLWIAPPSGLRQVVPGDLLTRYMIPLNGQSWSVFAPEPINGDYRLQVRANVVEHGDTVTTEWVDATAAEMSMLTRNLAPPRAAIQAGQLASRFKGAYDNLNEDQQYVVQLGYYEGNDWRDRLAEALNDYGNHVSVDRYIEMERLVDAYATQVAYALWGDDVVHVQFVISRQNVIPFAQRNNPDAERPAVQPAPTGWRGLVEVPGQSRENFADIFRAAVEQSGQEIKGAGL